MPKQVSIYGLIMKANTVSCAAPPPDYSSPWSGKYLRSTISHYFEPITVINPRGNIQTSRTISSNNLTVVLQPDRVGAGHAARLKHIHEPRCFRQLD